MIMYVWSRTKTMRRHIYNLSLPRPDQSQLTFAFDLHGQTVLKHDSCPVSLSHL